MKREKKESIVQRSLIKCYLHACHSIKANFSFTHVLDEYSPLQSEFLMSLAQLCVKVCSNSEIRSSLPFGKNKEQKCAIYPTQCVGPMRSDSFILMIIISFVRPEVVLFSFY